VAGPQAPTTPLRADAARNRRAIIDAASELYGQRGLDTPFDEIARHAGVGNATLYRHFPTRCDLLAAVFTDTLARVVTAARDALTIADAWNGFATHFRFLFNLQATNRGIADLLTTAVDGVPEIERLRKRAHRDFVQLAQRAQSVGALRADVTPEDVAMLLMANAGLIHRTADIAVAASTRFADLTLDGLRSSAATTTRTPPLRTAAVRRIMREHGDHLGCR
jgi:AcrR family transcriptional regulator